MLSQSDVGYLDYYLLQHGALGVVGLSVLDHVAMERAQDVERAVQEVFDNVMAKQLTQETAI